VLQFLQDKLSRFKHADQSKKKGQTRKTCNSDQPARKFEPKVITTEEKIFLQYGGREIVVNDIIDKVKKNYLLEGNKASDIKSLRLYIKPEENTAYYIINEVNSNNNSISLL
jgi:hypothetical protein